jgi:hypothetical protein
MNTKAMLTMTGLAVLFGCAASQSGPSSDTSNARGIRTLVQANDGTWVDEGVQRYDQRTLDLLAHTKFTAAQIDGSGRLVAYAPVGYAPGVTPPAEGTELEYEVLDRNGYVVEWKAAE